jgi:hypothetical protein
MSRNLVESSFNGASVVEFKIFCGEEIFDFLINPLAMRQAVIEPTVHI